MLTVPDRYIGSPPPIEFPPHTVTVIQEYHKAGGISYSKPVERRVAGWGHRKIDISESNEYEDWVSSDALFITSRNALDLYRRWEEQLIDISRCIYGIRSSLPRLDLIVAAQCSDRVKDSDGEGWSSLRRVLTAREPVNGFIYDAPMKWNDMPVRMNINTILFRHSATDRVRMASTWRLAGALMREGFEPEMVTVVDARGHVARVSIDHLMVNLDKVKDLPSPPGIPITWEKHYGSYYELQKPRILRMECIGFEEVCDVVDIPSSFELRYGLHEIYVATPDLLRQLAALIHRSERYLSRMEQWWVHSLAAWGCHL
jgi:hypothetical protein